MHRLPPRPLLDHLLTAAIAIDNAVGGSLQANERGSRNLTLVAVQGLGDAFIQHYMDIDRDDASACAQAMLERRRVVIRDVELDPVFARHLDVARQSGFRAVQSTPLIDDEHQLVGMLSTHFREPHHPSTESLQRLDRCCHAASLLLECEALSEEIGAYDRRLGVPFRALTAAGAQAANAARTLLPLLGQDPQQVLLAKVEDNLQMVASELRAVRKRLAT